MKRALLEILACPHCKTDLVLRAEKSEQDEIVVGTLACSRCAALFNIRDGVPCMLQESEGVNRTRLGFSEQWRLRQMGALDNERIYGQDPRKKAAFWAEIGGASGMKSGDWILDAGCGPGDVACAVAAQNPRLQVVGLDFCDSIYVAAQQAQKYPNADFVHGDIMQPPFKVSSFAGLYSWGVLHHTRDTKAAFEASASLVREDGSLAVWLYPHPSESPMIVRALYLLRDLVFLGRGHRLPKKQRLRLSQAVTLLCWPALALAFGLDGLLMGRRLGRQRLGEILADFEAEDWGVPGFYRLMLFLIFDSITPEYQFRHSQAEVGHWFEVNGFSEIQTHDAVAGYYWGNRTPLSVQRRRK